MSHKSRDYPPCYGFVFAGQHYLDTTTQNPVASEKFDRCTEWLYTDYMMKQSSKTKRSRQRINLTVSPSTAKLLERVAPKGGKGRLVDHAVRYFVETKAHSNLRMQLEEGYRAQARHDLEVAEEWFTIDEEAWQ